MTIYMHTAFGCHVAYMYGPLTDYDRNRVQSETVTNVTIVNIKDLGNKVDTHEKCPLQWGSALVWGALHYNAHWVCF